MRSYPLLTHAHTRTNTQRCQKCTDLLSALSTAKPLSTCNYTSHMGRSIRGLEILPTAHAHTRTQKHTALSEMHRSLVSACGWVPLTDKQRTTTKTLELMGHLRSVVMHRRSPKTRRSSKCFKPYSQYKSTNAVMQRYIRIRQSLMRQRWRR